LIAVNKAIILAENPKKGGSPPSDSIKQAIEILLKIEVLEVFMSFTEFRLKYDINIMIGVSVKIYNKK
jgi:hypothetical protein